MFIADSKNATGKVAESAAKQVPRLARWAAIAVRINFLDLQIKT